MVLHELQTPALLIRLDRVRANVRRMLELVGGRAGRWRPHVKTLKTPQVLDLVLDAGVRRFKCATSREALILLERSGDPIDLLVAMAHHGANLERIAALAEAFPRHSLSVLTEDPEHARAVSERTDRVGLFVDLNSGFDRTGIPRDDRDRLGATASAAGAALRGLHDYEGHVRSPDANERERSCRLIYAELVEIADEIAARSPGALELVTSGTPTFANALAYEPFDGRDHQVSAGTVVYWDGLSERFGLLGFGAAATVLTRVLSRPTHGRVTCDAGSKAIDAAAGPPCATVVGYPGLRAATPSEEHLPVDVIDGEAPVPGELLELVPAHVCPTVNLADDAVLMEGDAIVAVAPVAARGHEVAGAASGM